MLREELPAHYEGRLLDVEFMPKDVMAVYPMPATDFRVGDEVAFFQTQYLGPFTRSRFERPILGYRLLFGRVVKRSVAKTVTLTLLLADGSQMRPRETTLKRAVAFRVAREGEEVLSYGQRVADALVFSPRRVA